MNDRAVPVGDETEALELAKKWNQRHAELDRPPWPLHFGSLNDEMLLAGAVIRLSARVAGLEAERARWERLYELELARAEKAEGEAFQAEAREVALRDATNDLIGAVDAVCDSDAFTQSEPTLEPHARTVLELALQRTRAALAALPADSGGAE